MRTLAVAQTPGRKLDLYPQLLFSIPTLFTIAGGEVITGVSLAPWLLLPTKGHLPCCQNRFQWNGWSTQMPIPSPYTQRPSGQSVVKPWP